MTAYIIAQVQPHNADRMGKYGPKIQAPPDKHGEEYVVGPRIGYRKR